MEKLIRGIILDDNCVPVSTWLFLLNSCVHMSAKTEVTIKEDKKAGVVVASEKVEEGYEGT